MGDYLYFCASRRNENCPILRTKDPLTEEFTEVSAPFDFWDPDLFCDDDGQVYLYWGCTNTDPIYGIELDPDTMTPIGEKRELVYGREDELGYPTLCRCTVGHGVWQLPQPPRGDQGRVGHRKQKNFNHHADGN